MSHSTTCIFLLNKCITSSTVFNIHPYKEILCYFYIIVKFFLFLKDAIGLYMSHLPQHWVTNGTHMSHLPQHWVTDGTHVSQIEGDKI